MFDQQTNHDPPSQPHPPPKFSPGSSITWRLTITMAVTLLASLLMLATFIASREAAEIDAQRQLVAETTSEALAATLASPIWNFETTRVEALVESATRTTDILSIRVVDDKGELIAGSTKPDQPAAWETFSKSAPIIFKDSFVEKRIGSVIVTSPSLSFQDALLDQLKHDAVILVVAMIVAALATRHVVNKVVGRPIAALSRTIAQTREDGVPRHVDFQTNSELKVLIDDYNALAEALGAARSEARQRLEEVSRANAAKTRFLAMMSHELRTPLNGVLGMAQLLMSQARSERTADYASTILASGKTLLRLVDDVLDAARFEDGALELRSEPIHITELVEETIPEIVEAAKAKGLAFSIESNITSENQQTRMGDSHRISQVLRNLLENAVKFTPQGEVRLSLSIDQHDMLRIEVADTGPGVRPEIRERIFKRFRQADETTKRAFGGAGLGLAICRDVVSMMGGMIGVDDAPGGGALFWVVAPLPLWQSRSAGAAPDTQQDPPSPPSLSIRTIGASTRH